MVSAFARTRWWHREARLCLGNLQNRLGDADAALAAFRDADRLDVHNADALNRIAALELRRGRLAQALTAQQAAVRKAPRQAKQHRFLGTLYAQASQPAESREQFDVAQRLETEVPDTDAGSRQPSTPVAN